MTTQKPIAQGIEKHLQIKKNKLDKCFSVGAEAIIIKTNKTIKKIRIEKSYRHPLLDQKLRKLRTRSESKIMQKLAGIIPIPKIKKIDEQKKEIDMEYIDGKKLSQVLEKLDYKKIAKKIANLVTQLHAQNIIHSDLTTANMILMGKDTLYLIDFGLAFHSAKIEDKAVDLHLFKQALEAKHHTIADACMKIILKNYKPPQSEKILEQLKKVQSRGRYKERY